MVVPITGMTGPPALLSLGELHRFPPFPAKCAGKGGAPTMMAQKLQKQGGPPAMNRYRCKLNGTLIVVSTSTGLSFNR